MPTDAAEVRREHVEALIDDSPGAASSIGVACICTTFAEPSDASRRSPVDASAPGDHVGASLDALTRSGSARPASGARRHPDAETAPPATARLGITRTFIERHTEAASGRREGYSLVDDHVVLGEASATDGHVCSHDEPEPLKASTAAPPAR